MEDESPRCFSLGAFDDPNPNPKVQVVEDVALDQAHDTVPLMPPSAHALHIYRGPYPGAWGSGVTGLLADGDPFDASGFEGIIFWAKRGSLTGSTSMSLGLPTIDDWSPMFGICKAPPSASNDGCSDDFRVTVTLADDWHVYRVPFASLHQLGFGYRPPNGFDKANVIGVNFYEGPGAPFDHWIDDVAFYK